MCVVFTIWFIQKIQIKCKSGKLKRPNLSEADVCTVGSTGCVKKQIVPEQNANLAFQTVFDGSFPVP